MLERIIGEDIALQVEYSTADAIILADETTIGQILVNLAVNARDAMTKGGTLSIAAQCVSLTQAETARHAEAHPGDFVCLRVSDTGCGIRPEHLPHIFEPFFTTKEMGSGTGLGLSTVYGIIKQHRGWIEVSTQVNVGTVFTVFLPRVADPGTA